MAVRPATDAAPSLAARAVAWVAMCLLIFTVTAAAVAFARAG